MKKAKYVLIIAWIFSLLQIFSVTSYSQDIVNEKDRPTIIFGDDINSPPYSYLNSKGEPTGFNVELAKAVGEAMGYHVEIRLEEWSKVRADLEDGKIDAISGMCFTSEREKLVDYTGRHSIATGDVFTLGNIKLKSLEGLRNQTVVVQRGEFVGEYLAGLDLNITLVEVATVWQALDLIEKGKYSYAALMKLPGLYCIKENDLTNIRMQSLTLTSADYCMAVKEGNETVRLTLNGGMQIIKATGEYEKIYDKWLGVYEESTAISFIKKYSGIILFACLTILSLIMLSLILKNMVSKKTQELQEANRKLMDEHLALEKLNIEREVNKQALIESEIKYRTLVSNVPGAIFRCNRDIDWTMEFITKEIEPITGYPVTDFIQNKERSYSSIIHKEDQQLIYKEAQEGIANKGKYRLVYRIIHADGTIRWISENAQGVFDQNGEFLYIYGIINDITDLKIAEEKLRESERRYRSVIEVSNTGVWEYYHDSESLWCSPEYFTMIGHESEEFCNNGGKANFQHGWVDLIHPEDREHAVEQFMKYLENGSQGMYEDYFRMKGKEEGWSWIWSRGETLRDDSGCLTRLTVGAVIDITEIKKMEKLLLLEKEQFKTTLLSVGDGVISTDNHCRVMVLNKVAEELVGWKQEEAFGKPLQEVFCIINEKTREICENPAQKVLDTGKIIELANGTILVSRQGVEIPIEDSAAPIKDGNENTKGVVLVFRDFTDKKEKQDKIEYLSYHDQLTGLYNRKFYEEELRKLDKQINLPIGFIMFDVNGLKLTNDAFGHQCGDKLLMKFADLLIRQCPKDSIIARIGGDEYVVLTPKIERNKLDTLIGRIHESIKEEKIENVVLSVSSGSALKESVLEDMNQVFKRAEDDMYRRKLSESSSMRHETLKVIIKTLYEKSKREEQHSKRVSQLCAEIGIAMGLSHENINELRTAGLMHDIGKITVDDKTLNKSESLNDDEWLQIKRHPEVGYNILRSVNEYGPLAEYVLAHHERWDGKGYPKGLKGGQISLQARIIAVADAYDAMTADRTYRQGLSKDVAREEIMKNAGTQFDAYIVKVFVDEVLSLG